MKTLAFSRLVRVRGVEVEVTVVSFEEVRIEAGACLLYA